MESEKKGIEFSQNQPEDKPIPKQEIQPEIKPVPKEDRILHLTVFAVRIPNRPTGEGSAFGLPLL